MSKGLNKVQIMGHLGKDPEIRNSGKIAAFSVAVSDSWRDRQTGERRESTEWFNVVIFNENLVKVAEQYLKKGSKVFIEGKLKTRKYEHNGQEKYITEVVLQNFGGDLYLLDAKESSGRRDEYPTGGYSGSSQQHSRTPSSYDDDIPF